LLWQRAESRKTSIFQNDESTKEKRYVTDPKVSLDSLSACSQAIQAAAPPGSYMAGSKPADYDTGVDNQTVYNNRPSA